jgi:PAS domain S-box-containing protein
VNIFALSSLLAAAMTAYLGAFAHSRNPRGILNRVFLLYCLAGSFASFAEFEYRQAMTSDVALFWIRAAFSWIFSIPLELHFILRFTGKTKLLEKKLTHFLLYAPAVVFSVLWVAGFIPIQPVEASWGWTYIRPRNVLLDLLGIYVAVISTSELFLCAWYYLREAEGKKKQQAGLILAGLSATMFLVLISEPGWMFPFLTLEIPRLTSFGFVLESILVARAMWRYELFALSPATAAGSVIATLTDAVFFVNPEGRIVTVNQATLELLGYEESDELVNRSAGVIFGQEGEVVYLEQTRFGRLLKIDSFSDVETSFVTKDARKVPVSLSASIVRDEDGTKRGVVYVGRDLTERVQAEERIKTSLQEKEVLLKEIHHRVKNNLQVISSLLYLQSKNIVDDQTLQMFEESRGRVRAMALVHERLYRSQDLARVDFAEYVRNLADHLFRSYGVDGNLIRLRVDVEDVYLDLDTAIPCGLILNELVSNSLKHAFSDDEGGEVGISFHSDQNGWFTLMVTDSGVGFPSELNFRNTKSLGLQLVNSLATQLRGAVELDNSDGTAFKITFADPEYEVAASSGKRKRVEPDAESHTS